MDRTPDMEDAALQRAAASTDPDVQLKFLQIAKALSERRKDNLESEKIQFEAQNAATECKFGRTRFWASTITPILALIITGFTFVLTVKSQSNQFDATMRNQN